MRVSITVGLAIALLASRAGATEPLVRHDPSLDSIVVTARRIADAEVQRQVEHALVDSPYLLSAHVSVEVKNGVVTLSGQIFDEWDLRLALRAARRIPGVHRVVNDLEFIEGGE